MATTPRIDLASVAHVATPFRVVVVDDRHNSTEVLMLERPPDIGEEITLANGENVRVSRLVTTDDPALGGIILAAPS
jgi:hypothetical protein